MKRKVGLVVDSTFRLHPDFVKKEQISIVPLKVIIDGHEYVDGEFQPEQIIDALKKKQQIMTSQPSPEAFKEAFNEQLKHFDEVLCLTLAKTLSGTYNSATLAKTILDTDKIVVLDTETISLQGYYLIEKSLELLNNGATIQETIQMIQQLKDQGHILFTIDNLSTLQRSGRISKFSSYLGNILKIKPVLIFKDGIIDVIHRSRGFNSVMSYLKKQIQALLNLRKKVIVYIGYIDRSVEAKALEHEIYQLDENIEIRILGTISPVISAHLGLGGLGIYLGYE